MRIAMPAAEIFPIEFLYWMEHCLPNTEDPTWLGLPSNAEKALLTTRGTDMDTKLQKIWLLEDDEVETACLAFQTKDRDNTTFRSDGRPAWKISLLNSARAWMRLLPYSLTPLRRTVENIKDPFYRFFEREINIGAKLLHQDLSDVLEICRGEKKETNYHFRQMISQLVKGILPDSWRRYTIPADTSVIKWITDFSLRVKQLQRMSQVISQGGAQQLQSETVWLGGFFNPEAYVTATSQCVVKAKSWPGEELTLDVTIEDEDSMTVQDGCFGLKGLKLQGAVSKANKLLLTSAMMTDLPLICLRWTRSAEHLVEAGTITLPVYLNANRTEILFKVELNIADPEEKLSFYERGVALVASTSLN